MKIIVTIGRGGTGKSSFVALMTKYFIEKKSVPLLLIDADPDQNLGELVGVDFQAEGKATISELLVSTFVDGSGTVFGVAPSERIEGKIWEKGLYETEYFDFMGIGVKWVEGCYCLPNAALKETLQKVTKTYKYVLIDSPAGLEHLNRRIISRVNDIFDLVDPSQKAFNHVKRAQKIAKEVKIAFENFYVIGGYRFPEGLEEMVEKKTGLNYLGKISYDSILEKHVLNGKSLLKLLNTSPAYKSTKKIMKKAGY